MPLEKDLDLISHLEGLFVGLLDSEELNAFNRLVEAKIAKRHYSNIAGFLGIARIKFLKSKESLLLQCKN